MKPTRFMTNSTQMAALLQKRCPRNHVHQALVSGRCADAAFYPLGLIRIIIRGIRKTKEAQGAKKIAEFMIHATKSSEAAKPDEVEVEVSGLKVSSIKKTGGGRVEVKWDDSNFKAQYKDEYTGDVLPQDLIKAAIIEELSYFNERVW